MSACCTCTDPPYGLQKCNQQRARVTVAAQIVAAATLEKTGDSPLPRLAHGGPWTSGQPAIASWHSVTLSELRCGCSSRQQQGGRHTLQRLQQGSEAGQQAGGNYHGRLFWTGPCNCQEAS